VDGMAGGTVKTDERRVAKREVKGEMEKEGRNLFFQNITVFTALFVSRLFHSLSFAFIRIHSSFLSNVLLLRGIFYSIFWFLFCCLFIRLSNGRADWNLYIHICRYHPPH